MKKFKEVFVELVSTYGCGPVLLHIMDNGKLVLDHGDLSVEDIMNKYSDRLVDHYDVEFDSDFGCVCATVHLKGEF